MKGIDEIDGLLSKIVMSRDTNQWMSQGMNTGKGEDDGGQIILGDGDQRRCPQVANGHHGQQIRDVQGGV